MTTATSRKLLSCLKIPGRHPASADVTWLALARHTLLVRLLNNLRLVRRSPPHPQPLSHGGERGARKWQVRRPSQVVGTSRRAGSSSYSCEQVQSSGEMQ